MIIDCIIDLTDENFFKVELLIFLLSYIYRFHQLCTISLLK